MLRAITFMALLISACPPSPAPPDGGPDAGPPPSADAAPPTPPKPADACDAGEQNLVRLKCADSRGKALAGPNFHGVMWGETCRYNAAHGVDMKPTCIAAAKSCQEVDQCR